MFFFFTFSPLFYLSLFLLLTLAVSDPLFERKGKNAVPLSLCPVTFFRSTFFLSWVFPPQWTKLCEGPGEKISWEKPIVC